MAATMEAAMFIMFSMHACVCARVCTWVCACACVHMLRGALTQPHPHPPTPQGGIPPNQ